MKITTTNFKTLKSLSIEREQNTLILTGSSLYLIGFMPRLLICWLILFIPFITVAQGKSRPNVILIVTDDQGYGDIGFHGNPDVKTPVIDQLAKTSTRFTSFYVSPVCAPTRSSLMTGRYSLRTGVHDTYNGGAIMATEEVTIAELMKKAGYITSIIGKWHLGDNYPFRPMEQGFDQSLVHSGGGIGQVGDIYNYYKKDSSYFNSTLVHNGVPVKTTGYCSDVYTDAALQFLEVNHKKPFFLYLAFNAPHEPLQVPQKYLDMYKGLTIDSATYKNRKAFPKMSEKNQADARKVYGMVSNIDDNLGRLFKKLEQLKLDSNTVVIFMTDNGPQQQRYKDGLRAIKGSVYDGGVKVPFYIKMPGTVNGDKEIDVPAAHYDVLPTLAELCGLTLPAGVKIDGKSLVPLLRNSEVAWKERSMFFNWARGYPEPYRNIAVRKGKYKMVGMCDENAAPACLELYDMEDDPMS
ncbi:MAG: arylsulfatase [Chitinophagaceae bacterium]